MGKRELDSILVGTFGDVILFDEETDIYHPVSSTPADPSLATKERIEKILLKSGQPRQIGESLCHGTMIETNANLEGKLAKTALIRTRGFRHVLESEIFWLCSEINMPNLRSLD